MPPTPKVSIYLPVYNGAATLTRQLDSIAAQTFQDWRVFLIDNVSTDGTPAICQARAEEDPRFIYLTNDKNRGLAFSLHRGYHLSLGSKYAIYASANDYWAPEYLEEAVSALDQDPEAVIAYSHFQLITPDGRLWEVMSDPFDLTDPDPGQRYLIVLGQMGLCTPFYGLMRLSAFADCEHISTAWLSAAGDNLCLAAMALLGKFIQIPKALFFREAPAVDASYEARQKRIHTTLSGVKPDRISLTNQFFLRHISAHHKVISNFHPDKRNPAAREALFARTIQIILSRYKGQIEYDLDELIKGLCSGSAKLGEFDEAGYGQYRAADVLYMSIAMDILNYAASLQIKRPGLFAALAVVYAVLGRREEALCACEKELSENPINRQALEMRAKLSAVVNKK